MRRMRADLESRAAAAAASGLALVTKTRTSTIRRFAMLRNHLPRHCGIATFTTHLTDALIEQLPDADGFVVAMNDAGRRHAYPPCVRFEVGEGDVGYVTFPCGYTLHTDGDGINLYYGAADTSVALAQGRVTQILAWLDRHGTAA